MSLAPGQPRADVRLGGRWSRGQALKNLAIRLAIRTFLAAVDRIPRDRVVPLARNLGRALSRAPRLVARIERDLALAYPGGAPCTPHDVLVHAGEHLGLTLLARRPGPVTGVLADIDPRALRTLEAALSAGRGAVVVSAHLGPYELLPMLLAERGLRPAVLVRESYDPALDPLLDAPRIRRGVEVLHRGRLSELTRALRCLHEGRPVGILADLASRAPSCEANLLGVPVLAPLGPHRLARASGAPLLVGGFEPGPAGRLVFRLERIACPADPVEGTRVLQEALGRLVRRAPSRWAWFAGRLSEGVRRRPETPALHARPGETSVSRSLAALPGAAGAGQAEDLGGSVVDAPGSETRERPGSQDGRHACLPAGPGGMPRPGPEIEDSARSWLD